MSESLAATVTKSSAALAKDLRVAVLMNVIAPYHKPLLDRLAARFGELCILLSTPMEPNRAWALEWEGLQVAVQQNLTIRRRWRHPQGFSEPLFVHLPVDTIPQLFRFRPDVVISWEMGVRTILAAIYRRISGSKLLVWAEFAESTEYGRGRMRQFIRRILHRFVDGFLVTGESGARYLRAIGVPDRKLHKIVYTTDVERFAIASRTRSPQSKRRLLYVGQLIERKGLFPFLEIAARWADLHPETQIDFTIVGDGPLRAALEDYRTPSNLRVSLRGNIEYCDLPALYAQFEIFLFPTLADTWGVVVNEALAAGLPVLGSINGQAVSELVQDGVNGWTFQPERADQMYAALDCALTTSDEQLARMRANAQRAALRFSPDYVAGLVENAVVSCVTGKRAKR